MNWQAINFDWNQARAFLVTAEEGSMSAAARALNLTQPTLSRQVAALEEALGVTLFERIGRTLSLTPSGLELLDHVRTMGEGAGRISLAASGRSEAVEGQVTITASDAMAAYFLPPVLVRLRQVAPGIEVDVIASNEIRDLKRREADIAIRHLRPEQPDLIAKLVRETSAHLYASRAFLDAHGRPDTVEAVARAPFIGFEPSVDGLLSLLNALGLPLTRRNVKLVTNNGVVLAEMVRQGLGIGVMPKEFAARMDDVEPVLPSLAPIPVPLWLTTHRELHTNRRIRIVFDLLSDAFSRGRWM